jgi:hypothetical protein
MQLFFCARFVAPAAQSYAPVAPASSPSASALSIGLYAPSPRSSGHHASGIRAGSAAHGSRGRPSCRLSVTGSARESGSGQRPPSCVVVRCADRHSCGGDVPCHCEEWRCVRGGVRVQWVGDGGSVRELRSNDAAGGSRPPSRLGSLRSPPWQLLQRRARRKHLGPSLMP